MDKTKKKFMLLLIYACVTVGCHLSDSSPRLGGIENIPIELHNVSSDASSFIEKIEIIPLETIDSSLIGRYKKTIYDKDMDMYAIYGRNQIVLTFSGDGKFIGSSKKVKGDGPQEYRMTVDVNFNSFLKGIDLLSPYGTIYTYSPTFELLSKKTIKPEFYFDALLAMSLDDYLFTVPTIWTGSEVTFANLETQQLDVAGYSGTVSSGNSMNTECFYKNGNNFYFVPKGVNYYFYQIDEKEKKLIPIIYLDFGDAEIQEDNLPGVGVGERTEGTKDDLLKGIQDRSQYIRDNDLIVPLVKFFNDDYVYVHFAKGRKGFGSHYIYNRKTQEGFLLNDGKPFVMPPCFGIVGNVLMAIADAYYVPRLVDAHLMSSEEMQKMKQLEEDDNPVIIKYYLRK